MVIACQPIRGEDRRLVESSRLRSREKYERGDVSIITSRITTIIDVTIVRSLWGYFFKNSERSLCGSIYIVHTQFPTGTYSLSNCQISHYSCLYLQTLSLTLLEIHLAPNHFSVTYNGSRMSRLQQKGKRSRMRCWAALMNSFPETATFQFAKVLPPDQSDDF